MGARLELVFHHGRTGKVSLGVLAGALETDPTTAAVPITFVRRAAQLQEAIEAARERAERVLVAWSFYSPNFAESAAELAALRRSDGVSHVAGGPHATAEPAMTLAAGWDLVAIGEGEQTILDLVRTLADGADPRGVTGVAHRGDDGTLVQNGRGAAIELDAWPPFSVAHARLGPIEITRGCIYSCGFCQTPFLAKARFRHRSLESILHWVGVQKARGFADCRFISPTSLSYGADGPEPRLDLIETLLAGVRGVIGAEARLFYGTFPSEIRPEHVTPEAIALLRRYVDNDSIIIGGQSGSERVLAASHRGHGVEVIERAVAIALEGGLTPDVDFLFGLPEEGPDELEASLALATRLTERGARIHVHTFMPLPGTPLRDAPAGRMDEATVRRIRSISANGRGYGQFERQAAVGAAMAEQRRTGRPLPTVPATQRERR